MRKQPGPLVQHVVRTPEVYIIPRSDGRMLLGATVEEAGYDKRVDPDTVKRFTESAIAASYRRSRKCVCTMPGQGCGRERPTGCRSWVQLR